MSKKNEPTARTTTVIAPTEQQRRKMQLELLAAALETIPPGLPDFLTAFDMRIDDPVDQFEQSFYTSAIGYDFETSPSIKTNNSHQDSNAIDVHFQRAADDRDWERAREAYGALSDHIGSEMAASLDAYYYLGMAVALRAMHGDSVLGFIPLPGIAVRADEDDAKGGA